MLFRLLSRKTYLSFLYFLWNMSFHSFLFGWILYRSENLRLYFFHNGWTIFFFRLLLKNKIPINDFYILLFQKIEDLANRRKLSLNIFRNPIISINNFQLLVFQKQVLNAIFLPVSYVELLVVDCSAYLWLPAVGFNHVLIFFYRSQRQKKAKIVIFALGIAQLFFDISKQLLTAWINL